MTNLYNFYLHNNVQIVKKEDDPCTYPNCELYGGGRDLGNDFKPITCPRRYGDGSVCNVRGD